MQPSLPWFVTFFALHLGTYADAQNKYVRLRKTRKLIGRGRLTRKPLNACENRWISERRELSTSLRSSMSASDTRLMKHAALLLTASNTQLLAARLSLWTAPEVRATPTPLSRVIARS